MLSNYFFMSHKPKFTLGKLDRIPTGMVSDNYSVDTNVAHVSSTAYAKSFYIDVDLTK